MQTMGFMYLVLLFLTAEGICATCQRHKDMVCIFLEVSNRCMAKLHCMHSKAVMHNSNALLQLSRGIPGMLKPGIMFPIFPCHIHSGKSIILSGCSVQ
jgi:hypothetical protein